MVTHEDISADKVTVPLYQKEHVSLLGNTKLGKFSPDLLQYQESCFIFSAELLKYTYQMIFI